MNKTIKTLHDALTYQLQGLLYVEDKIVEAFKVCSHHLYSPDVKEALQNYIDNAENVNLKLDRTFNYLMLEPVKRKNEVVNKILEETEYLLTFTTAPHLKDIVMIACIRNLNAYKIACFQTCYLMAIELELDTAADMIQQILEWELAARKRLTSLSIHEFNNLNNSVKAR